MPDKASRLLLDHLDLLLDLDPSLPVLDLACGTGRNGLLLAQHGIDVVFADKSDTALNIVKNQIQGRTLPGRCWQVDLELPETNPFSGQTFSGILGFRYLHRPLFPALKNALIGGGLIVYETFTVENRRFGRPSNPDFLLNHGELKMIVHDWQRIHYFEGLRPNPDRAMAQIIARKPVRPCHNSAAPHVL